ncbi:hypothetical protein EOM57_00130 [Candidatus Saccharibacteria bacterium]|nr:hypothetical protein [Candidatus Saccharibacteria bacterium]
MKRVAIFSTAFLVLILLLLPSLLDNLFIFILVGRLPYSEVYLPLEAMFMIYMALIALGVILIMHLGNEAKDQHMTMAIDTSPNDRKGKKLKNPNANQKPSPKTTMSRKTKRPKSKSTRRQSVVKA